jgi:hypothetical protein
VGYISANTNTSGLLLKTTDGGENWNSVTAAGTSIINDFSRVNENIIFILYAIILRKLILILSKKYPKFYQEERKHIILTISIILASILIRIIKFALFSF